MKLKGRDPVAAAEALNPRRRAGGENTGDWRRFPTSSLNSSELCSRFLRPPQSPSDNGPAVRGPERLLLRTVLPGPPSPVHCVLFPLPASPCLSGPSPFLPSLLISILNLSPTLLLLHLPPSSDGKAQMQCRRPRFNSWVRKIPWRRKWKLTPAVLPGESHGQRSLVGYSPRGHNELDTTEQLTHINTHTPLSLPFSLVPLF